jgi:hypothetical protein
MGEGEKTRIWLASLLPSCPSHYVYAERQSKTREFYAHGFLLLELFITDGVYSIEMECYSFLL